MTTSADTAALINQLPNARVVCVGDLMLDRFVEGKVERISPEAPIPVLHVGRETALLGGAGNVARNLDALGSRCQLLAATGQDAAAGEIDGLIDGLAQVESGLQRLEDRPTTLKIRYMSGGQQLLRTDHEAVGQLGADHEAALVEAADAALADCGALVLSDYGKGVLSDDVIRRLIDTARAKGTPVVVDPKGRDFSRYAGATLLTPNRAELALASGLPVGDDAEVLAACRHIVDSCGVEGLLATRSEQGMTLYHRAGDGEETIHHLPARAREVFDVAGAGDTVVAVLAAGLAAGAPKAAAAQLANTAAGVVVAKVGTAVAHPSEILAAAHGEAWQESETKVLTPEAALERVGGWRRKGFKVGFTNGCFDLLHPGHVSLIEQARAGCDRLVVGLNSDDSVRRLKGEARPVQNEVSRATVLASLGKVDMVVVFGEDTPLSLIELLRPDVLIKGADYTVETVVGAKEVISWGGEVLLADLVAGQSTTGTIKRMGK